MLNNDRFIYRALKNIATRKGYAFKTFSYGWIIQICDAERIFRLTGYTFDINTPSGVLLARDKYATYLLLQSVIPEDILIPSAFIPCLWKEEFIGTTKIAIIQEFIGNYNFPFILKDLRWAQGNNVFRINDQSTLDEQLAYFESIQCDALLSPYVSSDRELRIILLDGTVHIAYTKHAVSSWKFNLSQGALATVIPESEYNSIASMVEASQIIMQRLGLRFASCDFFLLADGSYRFLEVNGWVCVDRLVEQNPEYTDRLECMYEDALEKSFI